MLKSLEVFGFKSFADRLKFDFAPGITAVVGPNGSGKSNVVDAIKWLLGDQSPKSLRGKEMSDVIFNGAANRKGSSFAEAILTIDNSNGFLPVDQSEISVGRRLWRSGDAEYLINRTPARLKDVRELFMGTGAGTSAYAIIEQGRVGQILQANPASRRVVFEEAAGISRYQARKVEAGRKLERVEQNLLRLSDIVDELQVQLHSLRTQADKAAEYRAISQELTAWWQGLAVEEYQWLTTAIAEQQEFGQDDGGHTEMLLQQLQNVRAMSEQIDRAVEERESQLRDLDKLSSSNREAIATHKATIRHQQGLQTVLEGELETLRRQQTLMENRLREADQELLRTRRVIQEQGRDYATQLVTIEQRSSVLEGLTAALDQQRESIIRDRQQLLERMRRVSDLGSQRARLQEHIARAETSADQADRQRQTLQSRLTELQRECEEKLQVTGELQTQVQGLRDHIQSVRARRQAMLGQRDSSHQSLAEKREHRSGWQARIALLEDLERRAEGWGIGPREILRRARSSDYPPWNRIRGTVADLLHAELSQAALLDIALGARSQLIVIEEFDSLFEYLGSGTARITGRVGFLSLSSQGELTENILHANGTLVSVPRVQALPDLAEHPRVLARADALACSPESIPELAAFLLADTWIVDRLDTALELARTGGHGCRFVTLQGELLEANGTLFVGSVRSEPAIVSRKSELRKLKNDLLRLESGITRDEETLSTLAVTLSETDGELEALELDLHLQTEELAEARREVAESRQQADRIREQVELLEQEEQSRARQLQESQETIAAAESDLKSAESELAELQRQIVEAEQQIARQEQELQTAEQARNNEQLQLAKQEEREASLNQAIARMQADRHQRELQLQESTRRLSSVRQRQRQTQLHILNSTAFLSESLLEKESLDAEAAALRTEIQELRIYRNETTQHEQFIQKQHREREDRRHQAAMKIQEYEQKLTALRERIEEEYQLPVADLVGEVLPARELYARELRGKSSAADLDGLTWEDIREEVETRVNRLRKKLKLMGEVNTDSLRDLDELETRFQRLNDQLQDLVEAKHALAEIVRKANAESKRMFEETFTSIRSHFRDLFRKLFGGGDGDIILEDPADPLECSIEIIARPPGKDLRNLSLMSGGEKTLTAVALLLAIFKSKPSPFCILDEVDAALDEANIERFVNTLKEFLDTTQFIMVTHRKPSMTVADVIYGVTMEQSGVSKKMSVRFEDIQEDGHFKASEAEAA